MTAYLSAIPVGDPVRVPFKSQVACLFSAGISPDDGGFCSPYDGQANLGFGFGERGGDGAAIASGSDAMAFQPFNRAGYAFTNTFPHAWILNHDDLLHVNSIDAWGCRMEFGGAVPNSVSPLTVLALAGATLEWDLRTVDLPADGDTVQVTGLFGGETPTFIWVLAAGFGGADAGCHMSAGCASQSAQWSASMGAVYNESGGAGYFRNDRGICGVGNDFSVPEVWSSSVAPQAGGYEFNNEEPPTSDVSLVVLAMYDPMMEVEVGTSTFDASPVVISSFSGTPDFAFGACGDVSANTPEEDFNGPDGRPAGDNLNIGFSVPAGRGVDIFGDPAPNGNAMLGIKAMGGFGARWVWRAHGGTIYVPCLDGYNGSDGFYDVGLLDVMDNDANQGQIGCTFASDGATIETTVDDGSARVYGYAVVRTSPGPRCFVPQIYRRL